MSSANDFNSDQSKIWSIGKELNKSQNLKFDLEMIKHIMGNGENVCYQHLLLFPPCF